MEEYKRLAIEALKLHLKNKTRLFKIKRDEE